MIFYGTGTCFNDAGEFLDIALSEKPELWDVIFLVHAICQMGDGKLFSHAWVEIEDVCVYKAIIDGKDAEYYHSKKEQFYRIFKIKELTKYTVEEACRQNIKFGTFGPWEPKYLALCKNKIEKP